MNPQESIGIHPLGVLWVSLGGSLGVPSGCPWGVPGGPRVAGWAQMALRQVMFNVDCENTAKMKSGTLKC